ncbi:CapA family protein [Bogoriella caseilytica]|uniref:Poly-gamma-glutamate synthesis protein (Capsule biosynthesis protein) n=1 Tax=Bogoriella caseilytica TaxID=56055 RepID=A0A3N2BFM2_9MICO|nr:CapA family protein [Bogoriella caseilytica]ROR74042.1 poly-gamma-glutamate synthesis protein (capsule biosynthesis protein) [Bogoriella caseilytica]
MTSPRLARRRSAVAIAALVAVAACTPSTPDSAVSGADPSPEPTSEEPGAEPSPDPETSPEPTQEPEPEFEPAEFTIVSSGDVLPHATVNCSADWATTGDAWEAYPQNCTQTWPGDGQGWDFYPLMAGVEHWIAGADLALCSLEVPIAPEGEQVTAYPMFGAPDELIAGLGELGFDGCNTATNHSMDRGSAGLMRTLDLLDEAGMGHVGTARTETEAEQPQLYVLERGGREITIAHIAGTTIDNGLPPPADQPWMVSDADPDRLSEQARQAREDGADLVIASLHWGIEYVHEPVTEQLEIAEALAADGQIDLIYGNHSHTPQPIETLDGGPHGTGMPVVWSMGNFISNQDELCCIMETATGTMVVATVAVDTEGVAQVTDLQWAANTVDRLGAQRIWPLAELLETDPAERPSGLQLSEADLERRYARVTEVMGTELERPEAPEPSGEPVVVVPRSQE